MMDRTNGPGLILLDKPEGITSFTALNDIKKKLATKKVGHTGTLDKFACGLLLVLVGKMTKLNPFFTGMDKEYVADIQFGVETDTLDPEGEVVRECPAPGLAEVEKVLPDFLGEIIQTPPVYSAVHINGERASRLARAGRQVEMPQRKVRIHSLEVLDGKDSCMTIKVACSKGTYIRSLARDLGLAAGSCAYVVRLKRTKVGAFELRDAVGEADFEPSRDIMPLEIFLERIPVIKKIHAVEEAAEPILHGVPVKTTFFINPPKEEGTYAVFSNQEKFLALVEKKETAWIYVFSGGAA